MKKNEMTKKLMEEFNEDFIDVGGVLDTTLPDPTMVEYYRLEKEQYSCRSWYGYSSPRSAGGIGR